MSLSLTNLKRKFWKIPLLGHGVFQIWVKDAQRKLNWISPHIARNASLLEIGSGPGSTLTAFKADGRNIIGIDVKDNAYHPSLSPTLYSGNHLPYVDNHFDIAMLLTTLHHIQTPDQTLQEAARVAKSVIIIEDIYTNFPQEIITKFADSMSNLEFMGHPHANRNHQEWLECFETLNLPLLHTSQKTYIGIFLQALYILETSHCTNSIRDLTLTTQVA